MPETATFDHYEVLTHADGSLYELGRGAMGVTYKAFDTRLQYPVCLKVINAAFLKSEVLRQRFIREARSAAKLRHRNVASVFHLGIQGDRWYYAMEFIDGETLETIVKDEGVLTPREALEVTAQVARALNAAAQRGLVHRDIKPANLMLVHEDGEVLVKVIDFGLVKGAAEGEDEATLSMGGFIGTAQFASPEQLEEREIDVRSDIYSLGVTLWHMLAGKPPFGGSMAQVMNQQLLKPPPFGELPALPPEVVDLLRKMLEKNPAERFQTPVELRRAIEEILNNLPAAPALDTSAAALAPDPYPPLPIESWETQFVTGAVIAGRFRITECFGETNAGSVFRAEESAQNREVRLLVLHDALPRDSAAAADMEREIARLGQARHPNLLEVFDFETVENASFLALEWTNGFSLLELLRARRQICADEAFLLLKQAAAGVDHALARGLMGLEFGVHQMLLHFAAPMEKEAILRQPLARWPDFTLKLLALEITPDFTASQTWAGGETMAPAVSRVVPDELNSKRRYMRALAMTAYELLGGTISPLMRAGGAPVAFPYTPLAALSEEGNETLKSALDSSHEFAGAQEFCNVLARYASKAPSQSTSNGPALPGPALAGKSRAAASPEPIPPASSPPVPAVAWQAQVDDFPPPFPNAPGPLRRPARYRKKNPLPLAILAAATAVVALLAVLYAVLNGLGKPEVVETPPPKPIAKATPSATPESSRTRDLALTATPTPAPTQIDKLSIAVKAAGKLEDQGDYRAALAGYLQVLKDFPDTGSVPGRNHIETLIERLRTKEPPMAADQFESMRGLVAEAAQRKMLSAMLLMGQGLKEKAPAESYQWYKSAADAGDPGASDYIGVLLLDGVPGVAARDPRQAAAYFQRAADAGYMRSKAALGQYYLDGYGGVRDEALGVSLLREAVAAGNPHAMNFLGDYLAKKAKGRPKQERKAAAAEYEEAFRLFTASKDLGDLKALANLGVLYMQGVVPGARRPDYEKGAALFAQGAKYADPFSMYSYARCLEAGVGIKKDPIEAKRWENRAAKAAPKEFAKWSAQHSVTLPDKPEP